MVVGLGFEDSKLGLKHGVGLHQTGYKFISYMPHGMKRPYEKYQTFYFLCSVSLSNLINIQPSILVFSSFFQNFLHFCLLVYIYSLYRILLSVCLS